MSTLDRDYTEMHFLLRPLLLTREFKAGKSFSELSAKYNVEAENVVRQVMKAADNVGGVESLVQAMWNMKENYPVDFPPQDDFLCLECRNKVPAPEFDSNGEPLRSPTKPHLVTE